MPFKTILVTGSYGSGGSTLYDDGGGNNRITFLTMFSNGTMGAASGTYGGVRMLPIPQSVSQRKAFYIINPPTGTQTIGLWWNGIARTVSVILASYDDINISAPFGSGTWQIDLTNVPTGTSAGITGTFGYGNFVVEQAWAGDTVGGIRLSPSPLSAQTHRSADDAFTPPAYVQKPRWADKQVTTSGTNNVVHYWFISGTTFDQFRQWSVELVPYASTPTGTPTVYYEQLFKAMIVGLGV